MQAHRAGRRFDVSHRSLGSPGIGWIDEDANTRDGGDQFAQKFQPLCRQLLRVEIDPRQIAARPCEARDKAKPDWVFGDDEDAGNCRCCCLRHERHRRASARHDHCDLSAD